MVKVGLLSDTHGYWDERYKEYFEPCDEIWHAGDIGSELLAARLSTLKPFRAVYGNIDGNNLRMQYPKIAHFTIEDVPVMMTHIGGYPGRYNPEIRKELYDIRPRLFITGHSHILKVMYDENLRCLHINPGAAGKSGFHQVRTLVRFVIEGNTIKDLEVIELGLR
ncbi:MAG: metallophosphatase family protein [Tannerellaceae bacterium]|nr:metallophosphatase family protein [Tannerellaceae bacterium]